ncbi:unnamed protein product [Amoebophrya sp. A120]|nr:unnamed protein product [Amoebophrya sp. A120]|eukprot:GSA120T00015020001.1
MKARFAAIYCAAASASTSSSSGFLAPFSSTHFSLPAQLPIIEAAANMRATSGSSSSSLHRQGSDFHFFSTRTPYPVSASAAPVALRADFGGSYSRAAAFGASLLTSTATACLRHTGRRVRRGGSNSSRDIDSVGENSRTKIIRNTGERARLRRAGGGNDKMEDDSDSAPLRSFTERQRHASASQVHHMRTQHEREREEKDPATSCPSDYAESGAHDEGEATTTSRKHEDDQGRCLLSRLHRSRMATSRGAVAPGPEELGHLFCTGGGLQVAGAPGAALHVPKFVIALDVGSMMHKMAVVVQADPVAEVIFEKEQLLCWDQGMNWFQKRSKLSQNVMEKSAALINSLTAEGMDMISRYVLRNQRKTRYAGPEPGVIRSRAVRVGDEQPSERQHSSFYEVHVIARGTSVFRKCAPESVEAYKMILRDRAGVVDFEVLDQLSEARAGQRALFVQHVEYRDPLPPAVLDVGGHSTQFSNRYLQSHLYQGGSWEAFQALMGIVMSDSWMQAPGKLAAMDPNPVSRDQAENLIAKLTQDFLKNKPQFPPLDGETQAIEDNHALTRSDLVVGITPMNSIFHFASILLDRKDGITADDLYEGLMTKVVGHDSKYLASQLGFDVVEKPSPTVSQIALLIALMRAWEIKEVKWDVVNGYALQILRLGGQRSCSSSVSLTKKIRLVNSELASDVDLQCALPGKAFFHEMRLVARCAFAHTSTFCFCSTRG